MEESHLVPFVHPNLDILFVGLNPATGSSRNRHYFSVNQSFWNQLYNAGLITALIDKSEADSVIFGDTHLNFGGWSYGITDLVTEIAESNSVQIRPTRKQCENLRDLIIRISPKATVLLHKKVLKSMLQFLGFSDVPANLGQLGKLVNDCDTMFFSVAFPHGNAVPAEEKVAQYKKVKQYLLEAYANVQTNRGAGAAPHE